MKRQNLYRYNSLVSRGFYRVAAPAVQRQNEINKKIRESRCRLPRVGKHPLKEISVYKKLTEVIKH